MEYIIGMSIYSKHQMSIRKDIAYAAGTNVVYYSYTNNEQLKFLNGKAPVHAVLISRDKQHIYTAEQATKNPAINIFKLDDNKQISPHIQLKGHKFGIAQILESPVQPYLISLGSDVDKGLFVWDLINAVKITVNKLSKHVHSIAFNPNGTVMVSAGYAHLKYWPFQSDGQVIANDSMMDPKSFILNEKFQHKTFVDLVATDKVYAITTDSTLSIFSFQTRQLEKWMDLKATNAYSLAFINDYLICACSDAIIRVFNTNLQHITTLQKPPCLGNYNVEKGISKLKQANTGDTFADCVAIEAYDNLLLAVYSDKTCFLWDITSFEKTIVKRSFLNHSGSINDLYVLQAQSSVETTFFVTASSDQTVRIWHIYEELPTGLRRNAYCKYLSKILYMNTDHTHFKHGQPNQIQLRCVRVSKDGKYLACGDSSGMLRLFQTTTFEQINAIQAHEQEILTIDFCESMDILATGSRDRLIHIYDDQLTKIATLDEHTSSVTHLRFSKSRLISCGLDKSIIFREYNGQKFRIYHQEIVTRILSIDISLNDLYIATDKKLSVYDIHTGKLKQSSEADSNQKLLIASKDYIATYSDKVVKIINGKYEIIEKFYHDQLTAMAFTMNYKQFITSGHDGCVIVWALAKNSKKNQLGIIGKKLKQVFNQQDLKMSKEWTINSFWVEEELKGFLKHQNKNKQEQPQEVSTQKDELFKFDSDSSIEMFDRPPKLENGLLSPLMDAEFNYKNQKFDYNDLKHLQLQLQQVHENISKLPEQSGQQEQQPQIQPQSNILHQVHPISPQIQPSITLQTIPTLQIDQVCNEMIQEAPPSDEQSKSNFYDKSQQNNQIEVNQVQFDVPSNKSENVALPEESQLNQQIDENSLQVNQKNSADPEQLRQMINNSFQGISRDSINLHQSYNYSQQFNYNPDESKRREQEKQTYIFKQTNLALYHLRNIAVEIDDLQKVLQDIQDTKSKFEVFKNIDQDMQQIYHKFDSLKGNQLPLQQSQIIEQSMISNTSSTKKLSEDEIKKLVYETSKDLLDNYSKMILEQIKHKQN